MTQNGRYHIVFDCIARKSGCSENEKKAANEKCELSFAYPCLLFAGRDSLLISQLNNFMTVYSPTVYNRFGLFFVEPHDHKLVSGIGDIKFSKHGAKRFEEFAGAFNENALYLAFRKNGSNTTVVGDCHSEVCTLEEHLENIKICKRNTPAITCILFATQQNIIWTYHGNFMPYKSEVVRKRYGSYFLIPTI